MPEDLLQFWSTQRTLRNYGLWLLSRLGIFWDLAPVPADVRESHHL